MDFGWRQWIFGRRILAEPRAVARHRGGATGQALGVFSRGFLYEKNAFATAYKNFDAEHFRNLMPAVLMAFVNRVAQMLAARNPGAAELNAIRTLARPRRLHSKALRRLRGLRGEVPVDDPLTVAHLRALRIHRNQAGLAEKRRIVQARRRRADSEIFAKSPAPPRADLSRRRAVRSDFFAPFLQSAPGLSRTTLEEIFEARG